MSPKLYVVWREDRWHVVLTGVATEIASATDRDELLEAACALARDNNGEVHVYRKSGELEVVHAYRDGLACQNPAAARSNIETT